MFKDKSYETEFKNKCDALFKKYCSNGWVKNPQNTPIYYEPKSVARSGKQEDTLEAKKTGHKSASSIASRVKRDNMGLDKPTKTIANVTDLTRCTIIVNSFDELPNLIHNLAETMENLSGWVCDLSKMTGYCAVHLKGINSDAIPYEIQIHTPETFYIKQISEYEYAHYREFNETQEFDKAKKIDDPIQRKYAFNRIKTISEEKRKADAESKEVYDYLLASTDARLFDEPLKSEIDKEMNAINAKCERRREQGEIPKPEDNKYIKNLMRVNADCLEKKLENSVLLNQILPESQGKLIENCEKSLGLSLNKPQIEKVLLSDIEQERKQMGELNHTKEDNFVKMSKANVEKQNTSEEINEKELS